MKGNLGLLLIAALAALALGALSLFVVDQRQNAIVFRLGEVVNIKKEPGLYLKVPLLDNLRESAEAILTNEQVTLKRKISS